MDISDALNAGSAAEVFGLAWGWSGVVFGLCFMFRLVMWAAWRTVGSRDNSPAGEE